MFLIGSMLFLVIIRLLFARVMPWRLISATTFNLAGVLVFVALGVALEDYGDPARNMLILGGFYASLVVGELAASRLVLDVHGFSLLGQSCFEQSFVRNTLFGVFILFGLLPLISLFGSGASPLQLFEDTWSTYGVQERSKRLIEFTYSQAAVSGALAIVVALQRQLMGFWYLSIGVVAVWRYRLALFVLALYTGAALLTSGGSRSGILISLGLIALVWLLSQRRRNLLSYLFIALLVIVSLLVLDGLLQGRQGRVVTGTFAERLERTLRTDFAYGGIGLRLGTIARQATLDTGIDYTVRLVTLPIPRGLWKEKNIVDPNWEMTEHYRGASLSQIGSITLFTPLGEALFYFGYIGIVVIPFLYGFTTVFLERIYRTSPAFRGLLAQVYIWSFVGMRHTYWNLLTALVAANLVMLCVLFWGKWKMRRQLMPQPLLRSASDG